MRSVPGGGIPGDVNFRFIVILIEQDLHQINHGSRIFRLPIKPRDLVRRRTQGPVEGHGPLGTLVLRVGELLTLWCIAPASVPFYLDWTQFVYKEEQLITLQRL